MGNGLIAFLFALGIGAWVSNQFYKRTGGNTQKAIGGGVLVGILGFILMIIILSFIPI
jgi:hypothetical protein